MGHRPDLCAQTCVGRPTAVGRPVARGRPVVRKSSDFRCYGSGTIVSDVRSGSVIQALRVSDVRCLAVVQALGVVGRPVAPVVRRFGSGPQGPDVRAGPVVRWL